MTIKALIVDDEHSARSGLKKMIERDFPEVKICGLAASVDEAIPLVKSHHPELIFLDIVMPQKYGFELIDAFPEMPFEVVFTTAYDKYAIQAFRMSALDYLLKPIHPNDLRKTMNKVKETKSLKESRERLRTFRKNWHNDDPQLVLPSSDGFVFAKISEIIYCKADGNYTFFAFVNQKGQIVAKTLKEFEEMLAGLQFMRIHRSYIINLRHISRYYRDNRIEMVNGDELTLSSSRKKAFFDWFLSTK
ncbi:MAG: LytTR family DNA-binding domain-containing protein [Bacteroidota bacterium]